jgi:DNA-binding Lrp family transcriptional regulator
MRTDEGRSIMLRDLELKLISELMKNSRRSDRDLAKAVGVSQPTATRIRSKLEKEGYLREYTAVPDFHRLGYELLALTFVKFSKVFTPEEVEKAKKTASEFSKERPLEIVMIERGMGLDCHGIYMSFHKNYTSYIEFKEWLRKRLSLDLADTQSFLISLAGDVHYRPLTFLTLATHLLKMQQNETI